VAGLDHPPEVPLDRVVRHAGHRHALGPLGQRHAQHPVGQLRVLEEHLEEVTHPEEQHAPGVLLLEPVVLPHRGRQLFLGGVGHRANFNRGVTRAGRRAMVQRRGVQPAVKRHNRRDPYGGALYSVVCLAHPRR